ncbi:hypothetical protein BC943DRAFT_313202 [Umbelopsis sp. AD052]|nr:hypothetical protein BC943DRAFT_313202 [Umbelopsis sp. AD052]
MASTFTADVSTDGSPWLLVGGEEMTSDKIPDLLHPRKSRVRSQRKKVSEGKSQISAKSSMDVMESQILTGLGASNLNDDRPSDVIALEKRLTDMYQRIEKWAMDMICMSPELDSTLHGLNAKVDCNTAKQMPAQTLTACSERLFTKILPRLQSKSTLLRLVCYAYDPQTRPVSFTRLYNLMISCEFYRATDLLQSEITSAIAPTVRLMLEGLMHDSPSTYFTDHQMTLGLVHDLKKMLQAQYNWDPTEETFSGPFDLMRFSRELSLASSLFLPLDVHISLWRRAQALEGVDYFDPYAWPVPEPTLQGASEQSIMREIIQKAFTASVVGSSDEASGHIFDSATEVSGGAESDWSIVSD